MYILPHISQDPRRLAFQCRFKDCPETRDALEARGCDVMQTDPGMNGPVVPFLLTCHAMDRAGSRQRASNTQHDDSAIDYLRFHDSYARQHAATEDDDL